MINKIKNKEAKIAVIGLGYVGLPIALAFAKKVKVIGFDINEERVKMMQNNVDPSQELTAKDFEGCDIEFTASIDVLKQANFFIDRKSTRLNSSHIQKSRMPSSA